MASVAFLWGMALGLVLSMVLDDLWAQIQKVIRREVRTAVAIQKEVEV